MNVLLIGSGGREHALAWALRKSDRLDALFCIPGNAGIASLADCVALEMRDHAGIIVFCASHQIGFVVIGPEAPLAAGLGDALERAGIRYFGPTKAAAELESSKGYTKDLCREFSIPTANYGRFADAETARAYIAGHSLPIVVKADGLAAGKGVVIASTHDEADAAIVACFDGAFGNAGAEIVIEEFLSGEEVSFFALCDGTAAVPFATAQDHKRAFDGDVGPNTGGMGAYSPAPDVPPAMIDRIMTTIINPTVAAMSARGRPFRGILFAGLIMTPDGPKLIEYNVRFGDPETEVLMMRLKSDVLDALIATTEGRVTELDLKWSADTALTVVMAASGYPGAFVKGTQISNVDTATRDSAGTIAIFHAGTRLQDGLLLADGGRVLAVTALGPTVRAAQAAAYDVIAGIDWPEGFCRRDIGWRAIAREDEAGHE